MEKQYFDYEPALVTDEGKNLMICFDVEHGTEERTQPDSEEPVEVEVIKAYVVRVEKPINRSVLIDAIVTAEYPADRMQAIINNYLLDMENEERKAEFDAMQSWRAEAKTIATAVMEEIG